MTSKNKISKKNRYRRLVAVLACRNEGSRLYGKPMQNLDPKNKVKILDQIIENLKKQISISNIVLAISSEVGNEVFVEIAKKHKIISFYGDPVDVLKRLIQGGKKAGATDVFRVTTESPFMFFEMIKEAWESHVCEGNDVTAVDGLPEGAHFEIYTLAALQKSHRLGTHRHRSELCSLYIRENKKQFKIKILPVPNKIQRPELRLTVDYPEDLALCRSVYLALKKYAPMIPIEKIIDYLDANPTVQSLVHPYVNPEWLWLKPQGLAKKT